VSRWAHSTRTTWALSCSSPLTMLFVLYTDGVTEARRGRELFGYERLVEAVSALRDSSVQELAVGARDAAVGFAGRLRDDLHVVAFRLVGGLQRE